LSLSSAFYKQVAQHILSCHAQDLPDLRAAIILLPNYAAAQPLAQALSDASGLPALLLPEMLTCSDWAATIPLENPIQPDTQRSAVIYQALREQRWFPDTDLWGLSRELLALIDDLTRHHVALPESAQEFSQQLAAAYQMRNGAVMQFEARVVHELWYVMVNSAALDNVRAYQQRLSKLALQVTNPLYILQTHDLIQPEKLFLQACRARVPVTVFDIREMVQAAPDCQLLSHALQLTASSNDLRSMAALLKQQTAASLNQRLQLYAAHSLEQEAQAAEVQIRSWLLAGKQSIAVVVQDRLVARRVRALLERARVLVQDETGWTFATLSVSTVLMRWLDTLQNDFYYQDLLDLLKSPFLFADITAIQRKQTVYLFEQWLRQQELVAHLQHYLDAAQHTNPELMPLLVRLRQAALPLNKKSASLADWLRALHDSLEKLGVTQSWQADPAGQQLLQLLAQWTAELQQDAARCSFSEWRRWLAQQLDAHTFHDRSIQSPVLFTHLGATCWRSFDAVLLLGCDATHLPAPANAGPWLNDSVRVALGLPLSSVQQLQTRDDLLALLVMNDTVLISWQSNKNGEVNLLSPYFELLRALHLMVYGHDLAATGLTTMLQQSHLRDANFLLPETALMPQPAALPALLPAHISPSGYNSLMACPYQFYARHLLHLNELDEVREELDKRDYGTWVHKILQRFHNEFPRLENIDRKLLEAALQRISKEVFSDALAHHFLAQAWLLRWQNLIAPYLDWQLENEQSGWRYLGAEIPFTIAVTENLTLRGRIDRVDEQIGNAQIKRVLDYKTSSVKQLQEKLKVPGEDVQLACYAQAQHSSTAAFISLDKDRVAATVLPQDAGELAALNITRLEAVFQQLHNGAALPAHGIETVCRYCEMNGLCRHGNWEDNHG
jgi:ATP-dependent helicase/nuclease subunit B